MSRDARKILEGVCPTHDTPLELMDGYGWCEPCGLGHSFTWDGQEGTWSLHLRPRIPPIFQSETP